MNLAIGRRTAARAWLLACLIAAACQPATEAKKVETAPAPSIAPA